MHLVLWVSFFSTDNVLVVPLDNSTSATYCFQKHMSVTSSVKIYIYVNTYNLDTLIFRQVYMYYIYKYLLRSKFTCINMRLVSTYVYSVSC